MCRILFATPVTSLFPEHKQFISHSGSWSIFPCYKGAKVTNLPNLLFNFVLFPHYRWSLFLHLDWFSLRAVWPFLFPSNSNGSRLYTSPILQCLFGMFWHTKASGTTGIWRTHLRLQTKAAQPCFSPMKNLIPIEPKYEKRHLALLRASIYVHSGHTNCLYQQD